MPYMITKRELARQIRDVKKRHPGASYEEALKINRRERLQPQRQLAAIAKVANPILHNAGLGVNRGLYMETPVGVVDGKMRYEWGKLIGYAGIGQERPGRMEFDPEGFVTGKHRQDGLNTAIIYAHNHKLWDRPPGYYCTVTIRSRLQSCEACHKLFSGRNGAKTCSAKCRKRLSRLKKTEVHDVTLIS